ncbi:MAG: LysR family transcriptional regulator [Bacteroidales bacterium]|jgi:molybdate transport repressor ModE-like protein|nr:LysR family transcriptional regulator [Bacteroidales bacterium]
MDPKQEFAYESLHLNYKFWLSDKGGKGIMGDGKWLILQKIEETGSLMAATEALGITYRKTWGDLKKIEEKLGFNLLEKTRGGKDGGQTVLTEKGKKLVQAFSLFHQRIEKDIKVAFDAFIEESEL